MKKMTTSKDGRLPNGRFAPGRSGNPKGRPNSASVILRARLANEGEKIAEVVVEKALEGDMTAAKLVLDRIVPPFKANAAPVHVELPATPTPLSLAHAFIEAAAGGELPPDVASQLVAATAQLCRVAEMEELRERLEALERALRLTTRQ